MSHLGTRPGKIWRYLMEELLERHPYIPTKDRYGRDALSWACSEGYQEAIDQLIRAGCSLKARDRRNWTPVHHVVANNRLDVLEALYKVHEKLVGEIIDSEFWNITKSSDISTDLLRFLSRRFQVMPTSELTKDDTTKEAGSEEEHDLPSTRDEDTSTTKSKLSKTRWPSKDDPTIEIEEVLDYEDDDWQGGRKRKGSGSPIEGKHTVDAEDNASITMSEVSLNSEKSKASIGKEDAMPSIKEEASQNADIFYYKETRF